MRVVILTLMLLIGCSNSSNLNDRVHTPYRLQVLQDTMKLTGYIKSIESCYDGDIHIRMKINQLNLLVKRNFTKQDSCMVLEIVCAEYSPFVACMNYSNSIKIPTQGDSITVTGRFVFDKLHRWNELHPVYDIKIIDSTIH